MRLPASDSVTLRTNLADYPVTIGMKDGRVHSSLVNLNFCGPKTAYDGFEATLRESAFDAGELAIVTHLQARSYGKLFVSEGVIPIHHMFAVHWSISEQRPDVVRECCA